MAVPAPKAELYIDGAWVDVTSYVLGGPKWMINRGEQDEGGRLRTATATLSLRNDKPGSVGIWSNDNPGSIYFRKLGRNTQLRLSMGTAVRFVGAVRSWQQRWTSGQKTAYVPIVATGMFGQLQQGSKALRPPIERAILRSSPVMYWPLSDSANATQGGALLGNSPLQVSAGTVVWAADNDLSPSSSTPDVSAGTLIAPVQGVSATSWHAEMMMRVDAYVSAVSARVYAGNSTTHAIWRFSLPTTGGGAMTVFVGGIDGSVVFTLTAASVTDFLGEWHHYAISAEQSGASVTAKLYIDGVLQDTQSVAGTLQAPSLVMIGQNLVTPDSVAHVVVGNGTTISTAADAIGDYAGETAGRRLERLSAEEGITFASTGSLDLCLPMDAQISDTLINLFNQCLTVDQGILIETRDAYGITYYPGYTLSNQALSLILDHDLGHLGPAMIESTDDDLLLHNDVTTRRPGGSFARAFIDSGPMSVSAPPDGVGTYDRGPITAYTYTDDQLGYLAGWIANIRSPIDRRWPSVTVELSRSIFETNTTLRDQVVALDISQVASLINLPEFVAPEAHYALVRGYLEQCDKFTWKIDFRTTPYWPYEVEPVETSGSTLIHAVNTSATTWRLATSDGLEWDTLYEPYLIQCGGEAVKVTAMATASPAYIATGAAAHGNNASVVPALPAGITPDVGQILVCVAAIRATAAFVNGVTGGWTALSDSFSNFRVYAKYYVTGDVAPTVSFAGGAAGDDTSAFIFAMSGVSMELDEGRYRATTASPRTSDNGSAQNIAYPALSVRRNNNVVLYVGWKQDDYTSVATIGDAEILEASTTTGNDQSLIADYDIQSTATDITAGSWTVTGGAAAISRAIVLALRPLQTATVVRNINNVNTSHAAGDAVATWRLGVSLL